MSNACSRSSESLAGGRLLVCHGLETSSDDSDSCDVSENRFGGTGSGRLDNGWRVLDTPVGLFWKRERA
jgi:hypothetical protein